MVYVGLGLDWDIHSVCGMGTGCCMNKVVGMGQESDYCTWDKMGLSHVGLYSNPKNISYPINVAMDRSFKNVVYLIVWKSIQWSGVT